MDLAVRRCLIWVVWLHLAFAASSAAQPGARNVLLLNSFQRGFPPHTEFTESFRTELSRRSSEPINFLEVSIQPGPLGPTPQEAPIVNYLMSTLEGRRLDLVVTVGGPAAAFAQKHRDQLFPSTPLLQSALDWRRVPIESLTVNDTVVAVAEDLPLIVENILRLLPETTSVFAVIGASEFEQVLAQ